MLALDARLVRADRLRPGTGEAGDGVEGDPTRATAELGRAGAELVVTKTVEAVTRARARR
jgi:creatinine amidohydrolase/Fe(II)-dependent formamide hydrolase-like protein